jgi:hypothetical protein
MNVEIATEAVQFPEKEYINGFFSLQCRSIPHGTAYTKTRRKNLKFEKNIIFKEDIIRPTAIPRMRVKSTLWIFFLQVLDNCLTCFDV